MIDINKLNYDEQLKIINEDGSVIQYIKTPSDELKLAAIKQDTYAILFIKEPSEELQLEAVKQNGYVIKDICNPSEEVKLAAIKQNPYSIKFIYSSSENLQIEAVKHFGNYDRFEIDFVEKFIISNKARSLYASLKEHYERLYMNNSSSEEIESVITEVAKRYKLID